MEEKNVCASESGELKTLEVASPEIPMTKGAMRYLVELGKQTKDFEFCEIGGRIFTKTGTDGTLEEITPFETECPPSFETATLDGLVTWLHADVDKLFGRFDRLYVRIVDQNNVEVLTPSYGRLLGRSRVAKCAAYTPRHKFGQQMTQEDFLIYLQTCFDPTEDFDVVAKLVGTIKMENAVENADDGISQRVTVKDGVSGLVNATINNPFRLKPKRTFSEVEQPVSPFTLRVSKAQDGKPRIALYENDESLWRRESVQSIGEWLTEQLDGLPVVVIA